MKGNSQSLKQGDIILVHNEADPRGLWKIAKIDCWRELMDKSGVQKLEYPPNLQIKS